MLTHARSYLNALSGMRARSTRSIGDPLGLDRLERLDPSGIPEGSIDSIDRGSPRARSTRSIADPLGLDRLESIDRGSLRGDPLGLDRIDSIDRGSLGEDPLGGIP